MENKDREQKEKERWDLKRRITVASVQVVASSTDLIGNYTSLAKTEDIVSLQYGLHVKNVFEWTQMCNHNNLISLNNNAARCWITTYLLGARDQEKKAEKRGQTIFWSHFLQIKFKWPI